MLCRPLVIDHGACCCCSTSRRCPVAQGLQLQVTHVLQVLSQLLHAPFCRLGLFRLVSTSQRCLQPYLLAECLLKVFTVPQLGRQ